MFTRHTEHDSLIIRDQMYAWNSQGEKGAGVINFAQMYYGMSFPETVEEISNGSFREKERPPSAKILSEPYRYPSHYEVSDTTRMHLYLTQDRNIHPKVVNWLEHRDYVAQDKRDNVVYKWKQQGEDVGANRQGTQQCGRRTASSERIPTLSSQGYGTGTLMETFMHGSRPRVFLLDDERSLKHNRRGYRCQHFLMVFFLFAFPLVIVGFVWLMRKWMKRHREKPTFQRVIQSGIRSIDHMDGHQFEYFLGQLLKELGYRSVKGTKRSNDFGAHLVMEKEKKIVVQAKR